MSEVRKSDGPAIRARILTGFFERMRGLLGRDGLPEGEVYVFPRCRAVHTVGMRFAIDIAFLDKDGKVLSIRENVPPGRWMVSGGRHAHTTVEAAAGWLPARLAIGENAESPLDLETSLGTCLRPSGPV